LAEYKIFGEKRKTIHRSYVQKVSIKLIIFRGKSVNNKIILKLIFQVIRRALLNLGFLQISNSRLTLEDGTDRFGRNVFHYKVSIKLIIFGGKRANNKIILKLIFQVIRRALLNLRFLQISNSRLTFEDGTDMFGRNVFQCKVSIKLIVFRGKHVVKEVKCR
jgi:hypothetical protein